MEVLKTIITILEVLASIALIAVVTIQSGKEDGLSALSGKAETFLSKAGGLDKKLASATKWVALAWFVLTLSLCLF
jgi:preprotein translocase subunit SecG